MIYFYRRSGTGRNLPSKSIYAQSNVQRILKTWAPMKANAGRPPLSLMRSVNRASSPMETKARENQMVRSAFNMPPTCLVVAAGIKNENRTETAIKPNTNYGKSSQKTRAMGFS